MITTYEELLARIRELAGKQFDEMIENETELTPHRKEKQIVYWFVAIRQAATLNEMASEKDTAWLFMNGIAPMDQEGVEEWLETLYQDDDWEEDQKERRKKEAMLALDTWIKLHFGVK